MAVGDETEAYKKELVRILKLNGKLEGRFGFDYEPVKALRNMIRKGIYRSIGGEVQIVKVFKYMNTLQYGFRDENVNITFAGRPLISTERFNKPIIDVWEL